MKNIIFIAGFFPDSILSDIHRKSMGVIQYAAHALQVSLLEGLSSFQNNIRVLNLPYIGSYPKRYKDLVSPESDFSFKGINHAKNVRFVNLSLYKFYSRYRNLKRELSKVEDLNSSVLVIYAVHLPFLKAAVSQKLKNPGMKICLVIPDLPEYTGGQEAFLRKLFHKTENSMIESVIKQVDCFVLLSCYMSDYLGIHDKPWVVVEGIFNEKDDVPIQEKEKNITILYTGTIAKRYGILNLLEAFSDIGDSNYRLWICGDGDGRENVEAAAASDNRITYFGQIPREEILKLQKRASILVNPRTSEGEFTKYSFPSKTMEYLASGTPTIINRLEGIPEEYFEYCFVCDDNSPASLMNSILHVGSLSNEERQHIGQKARDFIFENKTTKTQTKKIIDLINDLK